MLLLRGVDRERDQSYFLSSVREAGLRRVHFPCGDLTKEQVRDIGAREPPKP